VNPRPLRCVRCQSAFDLQQQQYTKSAESFWCPPCRFKVMDPFNAVHESKGMLKYAFFARPQLDFSLSLPELRQWRRDGLGVELRMVRVDSDKVCHAWPDSLQLFVNGAEVITVKPPEEGHKRRDVPQDISASLKPDSNAFCVRMVDNLHSDFVLAVVLTLPRGIPELSAEVKQCGRSAALARASSLLARGGSDRGGEEIVCLSSDKLRLRCPITMERVEDPVRGDLCQHLQCFSLEAYLTSNRQMRAFNNRWQCPVCSLALRPSDLCRDAYVAHVLAATREDVEEVAMAPDGSFSCPGSGPCAAPAAAAGIEAERLDADGETPQKKPRVASPVGDRAGTSSAVVTQPVELDLVSDPE